MRKTLMFLAAALTTAAAAPATANAPTAAETALTVYNQGPAVVWQTRRLTLEQGKQTIGWPGALRHMLPASLWLAGDGVTLVGATVPGDPVGPDAMLSRRIGQPVTLLSSDSRRTRKAILVSVAGGNAVVRVGDRLELIDGHSGWRIAWPAPHHHRGLRLTVHADTAGKQPVTLAYQRTGLNWHASYTGWLHPEQDTLTLQSRAIIKNSSNTSVHADQVALIAGDVARTAAPPRVYMMAQAAGRTAATPEPEQAGGYYRYRLDQPLDLPAGATRVLALMQSRTLAVERNYRFEGAWYRGASGQRRHASIRLTFENTTGKPLPAGPVRIYGRAPAMLLGEDRIGNVPAGARVTLKLGQAFDITAERRVVRSSQDGKTHKRTLEITVYNARDDGVRVTLVEHLPDGAEIVSESIEHASKSASKAVWHVAVPAQGKTALTYTIRWMQ